MYMFKAKKAGGECHWFNPLAWYKCCLSEYSSFASLTFTCFCCFFYFRIQNLLFLILNFFLNLWKCYHIFTDVVKWKLRFYMSTMPAVSLLVCWSIQMLVAALFPYLMNTSQLIWQCICITVMSGTGTNCQRWFVNYLLSCTGWKENIIYFIISCYVQVFVMLHLAGHAHTHTHTKC